jgi:hypothetical protein
MPGKVKKDRSSTQQRANPIGSASPVASPEVTRTLQEAGTVFERVRPVVFLAVPLNRFRYLFPFISVVEYQPRHSSCCL